MYQDLAQELARVREMVSVQGLETVLETAQG
jgi:hypothetical protein